MWDQYNRFVVAIIKTFCESAFIPDPRKGRALPPPESFLLVKPGAGPILAGQLLDMAARGTALLRERRDDLAPLDVSVLSDESLRWILLTPRRWPTVLGVPDELAKRTASPPPSGGWPGARPRTDDLLAACLRLGGPPNDYFARRAREPLFAVHRPPLEQFIQLWAREEPTYASLDAETWLEAGLNTLTEDEACDDVYRVRYFREAFRLPFAGVNQPPQRPLTSLPAWHDLTELDKWLVNRFDYWPQTVSSPLGGGPDPNGRLMLYLSYFGGLNAVLIGQVLGGRDANSVVKVLFALWRFILT